MTGRRKKKRTHTHAHHEMGRQASWRGLGLFFLLCLFFFFLVPSYPMGDVLPCSFFVWFFFKLPGGLVGESRYLPPNVGVLFIFFPSCLPLYGVTPPFSTQGGLRGNARQRTIVSIHVSIYPFRSGRNGLGIFSGQRDPKLDKQASKKASRQENVCYTAAIARLISQCDPRQDEKDPLSPSV